MIWLILIIPVLTILVLLIFFKQKTCWWEYLIVIGPSILLILSMNSIMLNYNTDDTEYLGDHVIAVRHYDAWDEWVHRTCSYTTCSGGKVRICTTHYYDCSYRRYNPEYWVKITKFNGEISISQQEYIKLAKRFKSTQQFVEMNRHYYTIDGDAQEYNYLGGIQEVEAITVINSYTNKVKASHSVFKFQDISEEEAKTWKLKDYPNIVNNTQDITIPKIPIYQFTQRKFDYINGVYASKYQIKVFILLYKNQSLDVVDKQLDYWQGGNKNELLIHIGIDSLTNKIQWYNSTSWMDKPELTTRINSFLSTQPKLDLNKLANNLLANIPKYWHRKNFKDFDYLQIELSETQFNWILFLVLLYNVGISVWIVLNEFNQEEKYYEY